MSKDFKFIIGVEGNIGVGKSYFLDFIDDFIPSLCVVQEPWNDMDSLLSSYYKDPYYYAFPFQLSMLVRRASIHFKLRKKLNGIYFLERTIQADYNIFTKLILEKGYITQTQFNDYKRIYTDLVEFIQEPDIFLYLRAEPEFLFNRIKQRNRLGESEIDLDYLNHLNELYDSWLLKKSNVRIIDIRRDLSDKEFLSVLDLVIPKNKSSNLYSTFTSGKKKDKELISSVLVRKN